MRLLEADFDQPPPAAPARLYLIGRRTLGISGLSAEWGSRRMELAICCRANGGGAENVGTAFLAAGIRKAVKVPWQKQNAKQKGRKTGAPLPQCAYRSASI